MSFLRARQRTITALSPHPGNPTHLIPSRPIAQFAAGRKLLNFAGDTVITVAGFSIDLSKVSKYEYSVRVDESVTFNLGIFGYQTVDVGNDFNFSQWRAQGDLRCYRSGVGQDYPISPVVGTVYIGVQEIWQPAGTLEYVLPPSISFTQTNFGITGIDTGLLIGNDTFTGWEGILADFKVFDATGFLQNHWPIDDDVIDGGTIVDVAGGQDGILTLGSGEWLDSPGLPP